MRAPLIYVINLATASDRRAFMCEQLDPLCLPYEFFQAIHGRSQPDHYLFQKYNDEKRARRRGAGAALSLGQLGCFASHYLLWEKCVQENTTIIVLEDDAIVLPTFTQLYEQANDLADEYGLIWLQPSRKSAEQKGLPLKQRGPFTIKKFAKGFSGTTGYVLNPKTAQCLLNYCQEWLYPVDNTMDRFFDHKIEAIGLDPVCITQEDEFESSIDGQSDKYKRSLSDRIRREYASLNDTIKRNIHNFLFYIRHRMQPKAAQATE